jgi:hypothetical protein
VTVLDSLMMLPPAMGSEERVVITDLREADLGSALREVAATPHCWILAWTDIDPVLSRRILRDSGARRVAIADGANTEVELVQTVRRMLAG